MSRPNRESTRPSAVQKLFTNFEQLLSEASSDGGSHLSRGGDVSFAVDTSTAKYHTHTRTLDHSRSQQQQHRDGEGGSPHQHRYEVSEAEAAFFSSAKSKSTATCRQRASVSAGDAKEVEDRHSTWGRSPLPSSAPEVGARKPTQRLTSDAFEVAGSSLQFDSSVPRERSGGSSMNASVVGNVGWFRSGATLAPVSSTASTTASSTLLAPNRYQSRLDRLKRLSGAPTDENPPTPPPPPQQNPTTSAESSISRQSSRRGLLVDTPPSSTPYCTSSLTSAEPTPVRTERKPRRQRSAADEETDLYLKELALQTMRERQPVASLSRGSTSRGSSRGSSVATSSEDDVSPSRCLRRDVFLCTPDGKAPFPIRDMYAVPEAEGGCESAPGSALKRPPSASSASLAACRLHEASRIDKEVSLAELEAVRLRREEERLQRRLRRTGAAREDAPATTGDEPQIHKGETLLRVDAANDERDAEDMLRVALRPIQSAQEDDRGVLEDEETAAWAALVADERASLEECAIVDESRRRGERRRVEEAFSVAHQRDAERERRRVIEITRDTLVEESRARESVIADESFAFREVKILYREEGRSPLLQLVIHERLVRQSETREAVEELMHLFLSAAEDHEILERTRIAVFEVHQWANAILRPFESVFGAWDALVEEECSRMDLQYHEEEVRAAFRKPYVDGMLPIIERDTWRVVVQEAEDRLVVERSEPIERLRYTSTSGLTVDSSESEDRVFQSSRPLVVWYTKRVRSARVAWESHIQAKIAEMFEGEIKGRLSVTREAREDAILIEEMSRRSRGEAERKEGQRRAEAVAGAIESAKELAEAQRRQEEEAAKRKCAQADASPPPKRAPPAATRGKTSSGTTRGSQQRNIRK